MCWSKLVLAAALSASLACVSEAGCYRGRPKPVIPVEDYHYNDEPAPLMAAKHMPRRFDWGNVDGQNFLVPSWGQHQPKYCGSCYVHGTLSMVQDRLKIRKRGKGPDVMLGRQSFLNCGAYEGWGAGCDGGDPIDLFRFMVKYGLPDESCFTYTATDHREFDQTLKHCPASAFCRNCMPINETADSCWAVKTPVLYKVKSYGKIEKPKHGNIEDVMMSEIYHRGPIVCSISTPEDFTYGYRGGIYNDPLNYTKESIDHNVEVTGWGEEDGKPYWNVRNSWGNYWGTLSFFQLQRGINSLFVNEDCWYAEPTFEEEEEVLDGDFSGSMYGLIDNGKESSSSAPFMQLDQALSRVRQELSMQLGRAGGDASLSSEVEAALSQVSGLASRLASSAKDLAQPASA
ncbi:hypothetical protein CVIRNUC_005389 [Coccomyxa viridis]|uniref:Peptidase C1A papain C-terminal domain-containing protein n=1 Tax=Coccomyxa viridis TaxID=1274662 RepID=A0AAV1I5X3_9CHLO|nr:hypothetical protein CVIRNUC_005389 [Coccomyxa viridis]